LDSLVIVAGFAEVVVARGTAGEVGSLIVLLRLWRLVRMVEEVNLGASEQAEELRGQIAMLEAENEYLRIHQHGA
jgi:voltage-gated hydrogen channel 1